MIQYKVDKAMADKLSPYIQNILTEGYLRGWSTAKSFSHAAKQKNIPNGYSKMFSVYNYMIEHNIPTTVLG